MNNKLTYYNWRNKHGYCPKCMSEIGDMYKPFHTSIDEETEKEFIRIYDYALICQCGWIGRFPWTISKEKTIKMKIKHIINEI